MVAKRNRGADRRACAALVDAIEVTEPICAAWALSQPPAGTKGFARIQGLADAVEAVYTSDEAKRRFEILARVVFNPLQGAAGGAFGADLCRAPRQHRGHLQEAGERRDTADVSELLKVLHRIVNQAIASQAPGEDQASGLTVDLSQINMEKLRDEFAKKVKRKAT
jgi:type I restriction enzyme R subunit